MRLTVNLSASCVPAWRVLEKNRQAVNQSLPYHLFLCHRLRGRGGKEEESTVCPWVSYSETLDKTVKKKNLETGSPPTHCQPPCERESEAGSGRMVDVIAVFSLVLQEAAITLTLSSTLHACLQERFKQEGMRMEVERLWRRGYLVCGRSYAFRERPKR
jgi:hypothetical protein